MAEQVRVRRPNVALRIPEVRFVAQEAEARAKSGIAQSLQRMSNYLLQQAEQKAQIEGAEYGAAQAPTEQQIQDAAQRGEELELPGDQTTVFGRAARKAALSIASDEVTALASKAHTNIAGVFDFLLENDNLPAAERQAYLDDLGVPDDSPQSFALALDTATAGYGSVLDERAPGVSRKFRAQMSIAANGKWTAYLNAYVKKNNEKVEASFRASHADIFSIPEVAQALNQPDGLGVLESKRKEQLAKAVTFLGGTSLETFIKGMDATEKQAAEKILTDGVFQGENPAKAIKLIQSGSTRGFSDGIRNAVKILRDQGVSDTDIAAALRTERTARLSAIEAEEEAKEENAEETEGVQIGAAMRAMSDGDAEAFDAAITIIDRTDPPKAAELQQKFAEAGRRRTTSDPDVLEALNRKGTDISFGDVALVFDQLSNKDRKTFTDKAVKYENDEYQAAVNFMRGELKIPVDIQAIAEDDDNYRKVQLFANLKGQLERELTQARKDGVNIDSFAIAEQLLLDNNQEFSDIVKKRLVKTGKDLISNYNSLLEGADPNNFPTLETDDFDRAINIFENLKSLKSENNKRQIPPQMQNYGVLQYSNIINGLKAARDAQ